MAVMLEERGSEKKFHFLPFKNGNRDEWISIGEDDRVDEAFKHS